jgi:hypothetical protein
MDAGRAVEYGHASTLLANERGVFTSMVKNVSFSPSFNVLICVDVQTGEKSAKFLTDVAFGRIKINEVTIPDIKAIE